MNKYKKIILIAAVIAAVAVAFAAVMGNSGEKKNTTENTQASTEQEILNTETTDTIETEIAESTETTEATESTESTESTETTEVTESIESTEVTESDTTDSDTTDTQEEIVYTYTDLDKTMYAKSAVNVRNLPCSDGERIGSLSGSQEVHVTGKCNETGWYRIDYNGSAAYVSGSFLVDEKPVTQTENTTPDNTPDNTADNGGGLGGKIIDMGNGYTIDYTYVDDSTAANGFEHDKLMATAGAYTPVLKHNDEYFMLIEGPDDDMTWDTWLCDYIRSLGGTPGVGYGNWSPVHLNGQRLYQISVDVE